MDEERSSLISSYKFLKSVLDTMTEHIAVIDQEATIQFVNRSWITFGQNNNLTRTSWKGVNYLKICDDSAAMGDELSLIAAEGIRKVIKSEEESFYFEYPCHSPDEKRWFIMRITPFLLENIPYYVIAHQNITERKIAEEKVFNLSRMDGLTDIPNRRYFDEFLNNEWKRCARLKLPIALAIIDIDHFKLLNDTYGHQAGDECLRKVGTLLKNFAHRPGDLCARYGGEEFAIIFANTPINNVLEITHKLLDDIRLLNIPNQESPVMPILTASIGLATLYPDTQTHEKDLIKAADMLLYSAKERGRNQVVYKL